MIGFVTWPPFCTTTYVKGGQVTKPIMHGCEIAKLKLKSSIIIYIMSCVIEEQGNALLTLHSQ